METDSDHCKRPCTLSGSSDVLRLYYNDFVLYYSAEFQQRSGQQCSQKDSGAVCCVDGIFSWLQRCTEVYGHHYSGLAVRWVHRALEVPVYVKVACALAMSAGTSVGDGTSSAPWEIKFSVCSRSMVLQPIKFCNDYLYCYDAAPPGIYNPCSLRFYHGGWLGNPVPRCALERSLPDGICMDSDYPMYRCCRGHCISAPLSYGVMITEF